jgi:hypothetical protein
VAGGVLASVNAPGRKRESAHESVGPALHLTHDQLRGADVSALISPDALLDTQVHPLDFLPLLQEGEEVNMRLPFGPRSVAPAGSA